MHTTWHARLEWVSSDRTDPDVILALMDELTDHAPSASIAPDEHAGSITLAVDADSFDAALSSALESGRTALQTHVPTATVVGIEVIDSDALDLRQSPGFPAPVIETAQGPLMAKAAIERWLETRNTRPGPRAAAG